MLLQSLTVKKKVEKHSKTPFNERDGAMIAAVGMSYFSAIELSLVCVKHLVAENGNLLVHGFMPGEFRIYICGVSADLGVLHLAGTIGESLVV